MSSVSSLSTMPGEPRWGVAVGERARDTHDRAARTGRLEHTGPVAVPGITNGDRPTYGELTSPCQFSTTLSM